MDRKIVLTVLPLVVLLLIAVAFLFTFRGYLGQRIQLITQGKGHNTVLVSETPRETIAWENEGVYEQLLDRLRIKDVGAKDVLTGAIYPINDIVITRKANELAKYTSRTLTPDNQVITSAGYEIKEKTLYINIYINEDLALEGNASLAFNHELISLLVALSSTGNARNIGNVSAVTTIEQKEELFYSILKEYFGETLDSQPYPIEVI